MTSMNRCAFDIFAPKGYHTPSERSGRQLPACSIGTKPRSTPSGQATERWSETGAFVVIKVVGAVPENRTGEFFVLKSELDAALAK